ncbi:uncharacterized protein TNCV_1106111 [Trichonephila clavipes]|nr:uncharacterized protein TNCV_1106111 [Trichonephila clavipes]
MLLYFRLTPLVFQPACLPYAASRREENGVLGILCVPLGRRFSRTEENGGLGIPLRFLWPTLHCIRVAGVSPLLSIGWWYLSSVSPKRHYCTVSAKHKRWWAYPLGHRPDAVALYSGCTPGKRRAWFLPDDRHTASLVGLRGGWRHTRTKLFFTFMGPMLLCSEARKLIVPQLVQTYAQATKPSIVSNPTQTDENITKVKCPILNLLQPLSSLPKPNTLISTPTISKSYSSTQAQLLPSTSSIAATLSKPEPPIPIPNDVLSNNMFTPIESSSLLSTSPSKSGIQPPSTSNTGRDSKQNSKTCIRKRKQKNYLKNIK